MTDEDIRQSVEEVLSTYSVSLAVRVRNGTVHLAGNVGSQAEKQEIETSVRALPGVREVRSDLAIEFNPPGGSQLEYHPEHPTEFAEMGSDIVAEGTEYDFNDERGSDDMMESTSEAEPYFPPTDTVIRTAPETEEGFEVVGGFSSTSMDDVEESSAPTSGVARGDEEIADDVRRELSEDALTADLRIRVTVRDGVAYLRGSVSSLDDASAAEEVASRVPGVVEVREELSGEND